ncbi:uncharacterized protein LOC6554443 [Drosophila erecta]|uniref:GG11206 n=1 Tax=Drosophila erecta TaxID=7220 RepID=B3P7C2_DROER|nr:uncharacterized protein LOC6554443 [Drosophila erecta]EDV54011.1 uncharacterized protein Dere_GG11206 [Drosophila erecta]
MWQQVLLAETPNWSRSDVLQRFWTHLRLEVRYRTLLHYRVGSCECWFDDVMGSADSTALMWNNQTYPHYLRQRQDSDMLSVSCLRFHQYQEVLLALSVMLDQILYIPVVLQLCGDEDSNQELNSARLILKQSQDLKMINVVLLSSKFFTSGTLYSYEMFPEFKVKTLVYQAYLKLFPYKLGNLKGHPIRTIPDNSEPHTIVQKISNGSITIEGPVWQLMVEFVKHINGTLQLPMEPHPDRTIKLVQVLDLVRNETVDIAASLRPYTVNVKRSSSHVYGFPMMVGNWCSMLPTERVIRSHEALARLMKSPWTWLILLVLYGVHRFLVLKTRLRISLVHLIKLLINLALICFLEAQLSAYFIGPQKVNHISNMQQLEESGLKIRGMRAEFMEYPIEMRSRYASSFLLHDVFFDLAQDRNNFNTSYGYTVSSVKWNLYKEAQRHFRRPLFRYSEDICVQKLSLFSLILQSNCLYRHENRNFILRMHEAGLISLWYRRSYYVMVAAGRFPKGDLSTVRQAQPIRWSEWQYVELLHVAGLLFSVVVFVIELTVHYVNVCLNNL